MDTSKLTGFTSGQDIFVELSHGPTLIDHNIMLSTHAIRWAAGGVACVHNLIAGPFTAVGSGTAQVVDGIPIERPAPYHIPHRTELAGFMAVLHGDDRIYNNIFIQTRPAEEAVAGEDMGFVVIDNKVVGTGVFDEFPGYEEWISRFEMDKPADMKKLQPQHFAKLPVWVGGNAYFNGAAACSKEKDSFVDTEHPVTVRLTEKNGSYILETNVYKYLEDFKDSIITSDSLGIAFEPEQRFENPDGSAIVLNRDYSGVQRDQTVIPGPFARGVSDEKRVW